MAVNNPQSLNLGALEQADDAYLDNLERQLTARINERLSGAGQPAPQMPQYTLPTPAPVDNTNEGALGDLGTAFKAGALKLPSALTGLADIPGNLLGGNNIVSRGADALGDMTGLDFDRMADEVNAAELRPETIVGRQAITQAEGFNNTVDALVENPVAALTLATESLPGMLAGGVAGRVAKGAGLVKSALTGAAVGEGAVAAGMSQADRAAQGDGSAAAALGSAATGVTTGLLGLFGGRLAARLGISDPDVLLAGGGRGSGAARWFARVTGGAITEGVFEELPQSVSETMIANFVDGNPLTEGIGNAAAVGLALGGVMGGTFNLLPGTGRARNTANDDGTATGQDVGTAPDDLPPDVLQSITSEDGRLKSKEVYDELSNAALLEEWERMTALEANLLEENTPEAATALGILNNQMQVVTDLLDSREIRPEQRELDGMVSTYRSVRNRLATVDAKLAQPRMKNRVKLQEERVRLAQRLATMRENFEGDGDLMRGVAQADFNDSYLTEVKLSKLKETDETKAAIETERAKQEALNQQYPDMAYNGSEEALAKAEGKTKKQGKQAAEKRAATEQQKQTTEQAVKERLDSINPTFYPLVQTADPQLADFARQGFSEQGNQQELERLAKQMNDPQYTDETVQNELDKAKEAFEDAANPKKGNAAERNKQAARVTIIENAMSNRGMEVERAAEPPQTDAAAEFDQPIDTGTVDTATDTGTTTEVRASGAVYEKALNRDEEFTGFSDEEIDFVLEDIKEDVGKDNSFFKSRSIADRREAVRQILAMSPAERSQIDQNPRASKAKKALVERMAAAGTVEQRTEASLQAEEAVVEEATGDDAIAAEVAKMMVDRGRGGIEVPMLTNAMKSDGQLTAKARKRAIEYYNMDPEEFAGARPKNANQAQGIYDAVDAIRSGTPAPAPLAEFLTEVNAESEQGLEQAEVETRDIPDLVDVNVDAIEALDDWILRGRFKQLTDKYTLDELDDFADLVDEMGDNFYNMDYLPFRYYAQLMTQRPEPLATEISSRTALNAFAEELEGADVTAIQLMADAVREFRAADIAQAREVTSTDYTPIAPNSAEADALMAMTNFGFAEGPVMQQFFNMVADGKLTDSEAITKELARWFTLNPNYASKTESDIKRIIAKSAQKMYEALADMRGYITTEQSKLALPMLNRYLEGDTSDSRFRSFWDKKFEDAKNAERRMRDVTIPELRNEMRKMERDSDEWVDADRKLRGMLWTVEKRGLQKQVQAERDWAREYNFVTAKDKERRTALFYEEMLSTLDTETEDAALETYLEQPLSELSDPVVTDQTDSFDEPVDVLTDDEVLADQSLFGLATQGTEEAEAGFDAAVERARDNQAMIERLLDSIGDDRILTTREGTEVVSVNKRDLKREYNKRVKTAFSLRSLGYTDQDVYRIFQIQARQEFVSEAIRVLNYRLSEQGALLNEATTPTTNEQYTEIRQLLRSERLPGRRKPSFDEVLQYPNLRRQLDSINTALNNDRQYWLSEARLKTVQRSGVVKPLAGVSKLQGEFAKRNKTFISTLEQVQRRLLRATEFNNFDGDVIALAKGREIDRLVDAAGAMYEGVRTKRNDESDNEYKDVIANWKGALRTRLKRQFMDLENRNGELFNSKVGKDDIRRLRVKQAGERILNKLQADVSQNLMGDAMNALSLNELRTRLSQMDDAKLRKVLLRAHIVDVVDRINSGSEQDALQEYEAANDELQIAQQLQQNLANESAVIMAQASDNATKPELRTKRRTIYDQYVERQQQMRDELADIKQQNYDYSLQPGTRQYKERVAKELRAEMGDKDVSVPALIEKLRTAYLHNFWLKLADNRRVALGTDGAIYTIIKTGSQWNLYRPASPDAMPAENHDEQVGGRFRTLKAAQEIINDKAFQREAAYQFGQVWSVDQVDALNQRIEAGIRAQLERTPELLEQTRTLRSVAKMKVFTAVERIYEVNKRQQAAGEIQGTGGETALYRAINTVKDSLYTEQVLVDLTNEALQLRRIMGEDAPVSPRFLMQSALDELYGPNPEKDIVSAQADIPSAHEGLYMNGLITVGDPFPADEANIMGLQERSQSKLRNTSIYKSRYNTETFVQQMTVSELKQLAEEANLAWQPDPERVSQIARALEMAPERRAAFSRKFRFHAPIVDTTSAIDANLFNASAAEAWYQVFGDETTIPVLRHVAKGTVSEDFLKAHDPIKRYKDAIENARVHLLNDDPLTVDQTYTLLEQLGYDRKRDRIRVVQTVDDMPKIAVKGNELELSAELQGLYVSKENRIYIVAGAVSERKLAGVIAHEMTHKLFTDEELGRIGDLVRAWAALADGSPESTQAATALSRVEGSLEMMRRNGIEVTQRIIDHETAAYMMQTMHEVGGRHTEIGPQTNVPMMERAFNWIETGEGDMPIDTKMPYLGTSIRGIFRKLFKKMGFTGPMPHMTRQDLIAAFGHKAETGRSAPSDPDDVLASVSTMRDNTNRLADARIQKMDQSMREASTGLRGYVRRGTRRLQFLDVLIENNLHHFRESPELDGANPMKSVYDTKIARQRDAQVIVEEINVVLSPLSQWSENAVRKVNGFIEKSTRAKAWGFVPDWANAARPQDQSPELAAEFNTFTNDEQKLIRNVFRLQQELRDQLDSELEQDIMESYDEQLAAAESQQAMDAIIAERQDAIDEFRSARGPRQAAYAKLQLEGKWAVAYMSNELRDLMNQPSVSYKRIREMKADPKHYFVAFAESERLAERLRNRMIEENGYPADQVGEVFPRMETNYRETMSTGLLQAMDQNLLAYADAAQASGDDGSAASYNQLRKALNKVYVKQLSENDLRKSELGRANVSTYEQDMLGIFARNGKQLANNIAAVRTNREIQRGMRVLTQQAQDSTTPGRKQRMEVLNEMLRRHAIDTTYQEDPIVNKILSLTSFKMLLTSPGYYMQNAMQPIMYTLPRIAGDYGNAAKVTAALLREQKNMGKIWAQSTKGQKAADITGRLKGTLFNPELVKNAEHRKLLEHLMDLNLFDVGLTAELGRVATPGIDATNNPLSPVADGFRKLFNMTTGAVRSVEIVNRGSAAIVAFDTFMSAPQNKQKYPNVEERKAAAREYATFIVRRTQGDYSFNNQPSAFKPKFAGEWARLATQFRSFQVIQWTILLQEFRRMKSDDPAEVAAARRTLMYLGMTHFTFAGALGLPLLGAANFVSKSIAGALGDEEEPADLEYLMYSRFGNNAWTDVLAHGFPSLLGIEATSKLGMGQGLITPFLEEEWTREYPALWVGTVALGASGGLVGDVFGGVGLMSDGYVLEGVTRAFAPRGVRDFVFATQNRVQGVRKFNQTRDVMLSPEEVGNWNAFVQGLGWNTTQLNLQRGQNRWLRTIRDGMNDAAGKIKGDYVAAFDEGDIQAMNEARREWREYQARRKEMGFKPQPMNLLTAAVKDRNRREQLTSGTGVQYQRTERVFTDRFERG